MWIAVTVMSKITGEGTRLKIICTVEKIEAYSPHRAKLTQGSKRPAIGLTWPPFNICSELHLKKLKYQLILIKCN